MVVVTQLKVQDLVLENKSQKPKLVEGKNVWVTIEWLKTCCVCAWCRNNYISETNFSGNVISAELFGWYFPEGAFVVGTACSCSRCAAPASLCCGP